MSDCCSPAGYRQFFNQREAARNLRSYQRRGLDQMGSKLVDHLASAGLAGRAVVEVGGGIGALGIELLKAGASRVTNVELSGGYEAVAADLAEREGFGDRVERRVGDFTELASDLKADDVVMHRVICCYPDMERLMMSALGAARRLVAVTFPRDRLGARLAVALGNAYRRFRGVDFRAYVHHPDEILAVAAGHGFRPLMDEQGFIWRGVVFEAV